MSETQTIESISSEDLRAKAKALGIKFTKNTSDDTLIAKIEEIENSSKVVQSKTIRTSRNTLMALKRVQVQPLNPLELSLPAKFITVANRFVTVKKAVQFNTPIFLEQCVIDVLRELKYLHIEDNVTPRGGKSPNTRPKHELRNAYNIVEMHTPTESEWKNDEEWKAMRADKASRNASIKEGA